MIKIFKKIDLIIFSIPQQSSSSITKKRELSVVDCDIVPITPPQNVGYAYYLVYKNNGTSIVDTYAYLFHYTSYSGVYKLRSENTDDSSLLGQKYQFNVTACLTMTNCKSLIINVTMDHWCHNSEIVGNQNPTLTTTIDLEDDKDQIIFTLVGWSQPNSSCPQLVYSIMTKDYTTNVTVASKKFKFNSGFTQVILESLDLTTVGHYNVSVKATNSYPGADFVVVFYVIVTDKCASNKITTSDLVDQTYKVVDTQLDYVYTPWATNLEQCGVLALTFQYTGNAGSYTFNLNAKVASKFHTYTATKSWALTVSEYIISYNTGPPYFSEIPSLIKIEQGTTQTYNYPSITDPDGDSYKMDVTLGKTSIFAKYDSSKITLTPKLSDVGDYSISIILTDKNTSPKNQKYNIPVQVYQVPVITQPPIVIDNSGPVKNQNISQSQIDQVSDQTQIDTLIDYFDSYSSNQTLNQSSDGQGSTQSDTMIYQSQLYLFTLLKKKKFQGPIIPTIDSISTSGVVKIAFDQPMMVPKNSSMLRTFKALTFSIQMSESSTYDNSKSIPYVTDWKVTDQNTGMLTLQLYFSDSLAISQSSKSRKIDDNKIIMKKIPPQSSSTTAGEVATGTASVASSVLAVTMSFNIILQVVLGFSMKKLWRLINTLQILVHLPLLGISIPSNTLSFFKAMIDISNLQILPTAYVKVFVQSFYTSSAASVNDTFNSMDIFQYKNCFIHKIFLKDYPIFQAMGLIGISLSVLWFTVQVKPYEKFQMNNFEIYNECSLLMVSYFLLPLTVGTISSDVKYNVGWVIIFISMTNLLANYISLLSSVVSKGYMAIRDKIQKCREKKQQINVKIQTNEDALDKKLDKQQSISDTRIDDRNNQSMLSLVENYEQENSADRNSPKFTQVKAISPGFKRRGLYNQPFQLFKFMNTQAQNNLKKSQEFNINNGDNLLNFIRKSVVNLQQSENFNKQSTFQLNQENSASKEYEDSYLNKMDSQYPQRQKTRSKFKPKQIGVEDQSIKNAQVNRFGDSVYDLAKIFQSVEDKKDFGDKQDAHSFQSLGDKKELTLKFGTLLDKIKDRAKNVAEENINKSQNHYQQKEYQF
eukprot:403355892